MYACASSRGISRFSDEPERRDAVDDPEVDHLRDVALDLRQRRRILAEHLGRGARVDVLAALERLAQLRLAGDVREDPQLDLASSRRRASRCPSSATNAERISRPSSVRIGIAWRFGFEVDSRPVAATAWLKVVWSRPSCSEISEGSGTRYVFSSFE